MGLTMIFQNANVIKVEYKIFKIFNIIKQKKEKQTGIKNRTPTIQWHVIDDNNCEKLYSPIKRISNYVQTQN